MHILYPALCIEQQNDTLYFILKVTFSKFQCIQLNLMLSSKYLNIITKHFYVLLQPSVHESLLSPTVYQLLVCY